MEFDSVISARHSVRNYRTTAISDSDILKILQSADLAPSAGGLKAREVFIVKSAAVRRELAKASDQEFVVEAPVVMIFCANLDAISPYGNRGRDLYCIQDAAAAVENALLKAADLGLGTCWVGAFDEEKVSKICDIPSWLRPVALVTLGYERS